MIHMIPRIEKQGYDVDAPDECDAVFHSQGGS